MEDLEKVRMFVDGEEKTFKEAVTNLIKVVDEDGFETWLNGIVFTDGTEAPVKDITIEILDHKKKPVEAYLVSAFCNNPDVVETPVGIYFPGKNREQFKKAKEFIKDNKGTEEIHFGGDFNTYDTDGEIQFDFKYASFVVEYWCCGFSCKIRDFSKHDDDIRVSADVTHIVMEEKTND